jgi:hypothetical protein
MESVQKTFTKLEQTLCMKIMCLWRKENPQKKNKANNMFSSGLVSNSMTSESYLICK